LSLQKVFGRSFSSGADRSRRREDEIDAQVGLHVFVGLAPAGDVVEAADKAIWAFAEL
jgi:hypothetical protein